MTKAFVKAALTFMLIGLVCGCVIGICIASRSTAERVEYDTIVHHDPAVRDSMVVRYVTRYLPVVRHDTLKADTVGAERIKNDTTVYLSDSNDSAEVIIPITQKRYETTDYRAYVSGYEPRLDSIFVFHKMTTGDRQRDRWHIGITGGYGYGLNGRQAGPYVGIGITYSLISF